jgi:hypothetical protein
VEDNAVGRKLNDAKRINERRLEHAAATIGSDRRSIERIICWRDFPFASARLRCFTVNGIDNEFQNHFHDVVNFALFDLLALIIIFFEKCEWTHVRHLDPYAGFFDFENDRLIFMQSFLWPFRKECFHIRNYR